MATSSPVYKFILVGDTKVGKTSILSVFVNDKFLVEVPSTIGVNFYIKQFKFSYNGKEIPAKLQLWDVAGAERYQSLTNAYYRNAHAIAAVFDLSNEKSFAKVKSVVKTAQEFYDGKKIPIILVGNKCDRTTQVDEAEIQDFVEENEFDYIETSARDSIGINQLFSTMCVASYSTQIDPSETETVVNVAENLNESIKSFEITDGDSNNYLHDQKDKT